MPIFFGLQQRRSSGRRIRIGSSEEELDGMTSAFSVDGPPGRQSFTIVLFLAVWNLPDTHNSRLGRWGGELTAEKTKECVCPECTENPASWCSRNCSVNDWESELKWSGRMDLNHRP